MPGSGVKFASKELAGVLGHYEIGTVSQATPLSGGNKRAPKIVVVSDHGVFLLKRRPRASSNIQRVEFAHSVQQYLAEKGFPATVLVSTRDEKKTVLEIDHHIYECFKFVSGVRYDGSPEATVDTGRQLAKLHRYLAGYDGQGIKLKGSFHDSTTVRRHLKATTKTLKRIWANGTVKEGAKKELQKTVEVLMHLYNDSSVRVNQRGFDSWDKQVVHGDWHPGNMLFTDRRITAVLDFDSVKMAPPVTDLANGMLQFSIVGNRPNPVDWPDYLDQAKLIQFLDGYREVIDLESNMLKSLLDLMIETIIAESVLPVAATGFFGNLCGLEFLQMIKRKAQWMHENREMLTKAMRH